MVRCAFKTFVRAEWANALTDFGNSVLGIYPASGANTCRVAVQRRDGAIYGALAGVTVCPCLATGTWLNRAQRCPLSVCF